jgi:UDP-N-acetylmuramoyl-tripeptide--D-alanyl-D-alanine ligase
MERRGGKDARRLSAALRADGFRPNLPDADVAGRWLRQNLRKGDVVLVEGSRGVHLERAFEALKRQ